MKIDIMATGLTLDQAVRERFSRRLYFVLGRFLSVVRRVDVNVSDENGPKGGLDKRCRIQVVLHGSEAVTVEGEGESIQKVFESTCQRAGRTVARTLQRKRHKGRSSRRANGQAAS